MRPLCSSGWRTRGPTWMTVFRALLTPTAGHTPYWSFMLVFHLFQWYNDELEQLNGFFSWLGRIWGGHLVEQSWFCKSQKDIFAWDCWMVMQRRRFLWMTPLYFSWAYHSHALVWQIFAHANHMHPYLQPSCHQILCFLSFRIFSMDGNSRECRERRSQCAL